MVKGRHQSVIRWKMKFLLNSLSLYYYYTILFPIHALNPTPFPLRGAHWEKSIKQLLISSLYWFSGERGGSVVECRTPEREVGGSKPTATVLCPWARHFTPRKYWLITQEAVAPSRHDWKIVDWDVKHQHTHIDFPSMCLNWTKLCLEIT